MPKTKKKKVPVKKTVAKKVAPKKTVKAVKTVRAAVAKKPTSSFSPEFTNALLVIFGAGMVLFAYVIFKVYGT